MRSSSAPHRLPCSATKASEPVEAQQPATPKDTKNASSWFEDSFSTPIADLLNDPTVSLGVDDTAKLAFENPEPTVKLPTQTPEQQSTLKFWSHRSSNSPATPSSRSFPSSIRKPPPTPSTW